jgi:hypothetical protein
MGACSHNWLFIAAHQNDGGASASRRCAHDLRAFRRLVCLALRRRFVGRVSLEANRWHNRLTAVINGDRTRVTLASSEDNVMDRIKRIGAGLCFILVPLILIFAFASHPDLRI